MAAVDRVARGELALSPYPSTAAALRAVDLQQVYAALDLASSRPTLYVASSAGVSVARVLERIAITDPAVRLIDTTRCRSMIPTGWRSSTWC